MRINGRTFAAPVLMAAALLAGATAARAQEAERATPTIRVSATGESRVAPDRAWVDFGVETEAATARQAADENARKMEQVIAALVRSGIARADIQTSGYNVFPVYEPVPGREEQPRLRGYRVINTVTAQTDEVARVGSLLDAGLAAGANRVNSVRFGLRDPARARGAALRDALTRARAEAAVIAEGLGVRLGRVLDASTAYSAPPPFVPIAYRREAMAMDAAGSSTPIEPGQQEVSATVTIVFEIGG